MKFGTSVPVEGRPGLWRIIAGNSPILLGSVAKDLLACVGMEVDEFGPVVVEDGFGMDLPLPRVGSAVVVLVAALGKEC